MKLLAASTVILSILTPSAFAEVEGEVKITRSGSQSSQSGPENYFTGKVRIDATFQATSPARVGGATITFEPGARTVWHTHPLGQTLVIAQGRGWLQEWGSEIKEMNQGDIIGIPAGVKHWHGATPDTAMTHIAIAESLNGSPVEWMEKVSDEQYQK